MSETNLTPAGQTAPAEFDYSVLDTDTAEKLRGITECVCELQQSYAWGMAYQVGRAHDLLCGGGSCLTVRQLDKKQTEIAVMPHLPRGVNTLESADQQPITY